MIKQLRIRFITISMFSLMLVLFIILGGINLMSYQKVVDDADAILSVLTANNGVFPKKEPAGDPPGGAQNNGIPAKNAGKGNLSPEVPFESRYFSVLLDGTGQVVQTNLDQIAAIDGQTAAAYAVEVLSSGKEISFYGDYRYALCSENGGSRIIFLDCTRSLSNFRTTLFSSISVAILGLAAVLLLLMVLSKRIIKPVAESYEKQKRFITDAGHEIKTPLTIISADTDLAEMELGENEWLSDIKHQTQHLTGLTNELIYLSRMDEEQPKLQPIEFPLSDVVEEMAQSFLAPAKTHGKEFEMSIQPMLSFTGDEKALRQLVSILLDNALKYSPDGGHISLCLEKQNRSLRLMVANTTDQPMEADKLKHLFDRFYRTDQSRNSQTGGYGLGLSIAQSIVSAHKGKIWAESPDKQTLSITVILAAQ